MLNSSTTVSAELALTLIVPEHGTVPLVAGLYYSADDPYAIRMAFHVGTDEPVVWIFARELLATGLAFIVALQVFVIVGGDQCDLGIAEKAPARLLRDQIAGETVGGLDDDR